MTDFASVLLSSFQLIIKLELTQFWRIVFLEIPWYFFDSKFVTDHSICSRSPAIQFGTFVQVLDIVVGQAHEAVVGVYPNKLKGKDTPERSQFHASTRLEAHSCYDSFDRYTKLLLVYSQVQTRSI
jgi:hypothetical protein